MISIFVSISLLVCVTMCKKDRIKCYCYINCCIKCYTNKIYNIDVAVFSFLCFFLVFL